MTSNITELPVIIPKKSYFEKAWKDISYLPEGSLVFFDVENTAIVVKNGETFIRQDFVELFHALTEERKDLGLFALTYRSEDTGIDELQDYPFLNVIFAERISEVLQSTSDFKLASAVIAALSEIPDLSQNEELAIKITDGPWQKIKYLMLMFQEFFATVYLIDDGPDGELAEALGVGLKA